jgi:hypothetical protein
LIHWRLRFLSAKILRMQNFSRNAATDPESDSQLNRLAIQERVRAHRVENVKTVLIVISARGMTLDVESLRYLIPLTYAGARVYFMTTLGIPYGEAPPSPIDLLIDFTGPRQRHKWFLARRLRARARVAIGRNAGIFRPYIYDRVYDELANKAEVPRDVLARERFVQKKILEMAGIPISTQGELGPDLGKKIAVDLPPLKRG